MRCIICTEDIPHRRLQLKLPTCSAKCHETYKVLTKEPRRIDLRKQAKEILKKRPECCSPIAWMEWHSFNDMLPLKSQDIFCEDCSPEFQSRMIEQRKCACPFYEPLEEDV